MVLADWLGYVGSVVVLSSFLMRDVVKLRILNILGCLLFIVFGVLINQMPVVITNSAIVLINLWFLLPRKKKKKV